MRIRASSSTRPASRPRRANAQGGNLVEENFETTFASSEKLQPAARAADLIINHNWEPRGFRDLLISSGGSTYLNNENYYKISILPGDEQSQVFYDIEHLRQHWGRWLKIISVTQEAWWYQTAVLMEK
jgi:hypothetical protein